MNVAFPRRTFLTRSFGEIVFRRDKRFSTFFEILRRNQTFQTRIFHVSRLDEESTQTFVIVLRITNELPATNGRHPAIRFEEYRLHQRLILLLSLELIYLGPDRRRNECERKPADVEEENDEKKNALYLRGGRRIEIIRHNFKSHCTTRISQFIL